MSFTTFSITRQVMKSGELPQAAWQGFNNPSPTASRLLPSYDLASTSSTLGSSYNVVSGNSYQTMSTGRHLSPRMKNRPSSVIRPPLKTHHSYPSLKRSHQTYEQSQYSETMPEMYETLPDVENQRKPTVHPDHRLLSFGQTQRRHAIVDQYGRSETVEITAQLHGMFFLSEIATNSGESITIQPELTCYRRNLFQISGSIASPSGKISVITEQGQTVPVVSLELCISATESVDGHIVRLIVIPWKTPPPNSTEVQPNQEQEPPPIVLDSHAERGQETSNEVLIQSIAWRRLQFRVATANNGRRKELQQHFVLRLNLNAIMPDNTRLCIAEAATAPIVVRGRSPRNFQTRKEIALVGSSASPRGQTVQSSPAEKKVIVLSEKAKNRGMHHPELPQRPFQYSISDFPQPPQLLRQSFAHWNESERQLDEAMVPHGKTAYGTSQVISKGYLQAGYSGSDTTQSNASASHQSHSSGIEGTTSPQFYDHGSASNSSTLSFPFMDSNQRPAKTARHTAPSPVSTLPAYSPFGERHPPPYSVNGPANDSAKSHREFFPVTLEPDTWSTTEQGQVMYTTSIPSLSPQHFTFPSQGFSKDEPLPGIYNWSPS